MFEVWELSSCFFGMFVDDVRSKVLEVALSPWSELSHVSYR